ncbi:MAG TPA: CRISPR-associated endonuclease Cas1 [Kofleriaceae bacterium]|nr:CRISPR-associated endonuclease Cas1 [Kofleriaceae bacterium]
MLNEHAYCPRLAYLEWVQGDFRDNAETVDGRFQHRNVDVERGDMPDPGDEARIHARSVKLSAPQLGMIATIDLVELHGARATPVDYKRGRAPDTEEGAWEPERVQLCAQALILEENGYEVQAGILYFVGSKQRVEIEFDDRLRARTRELLAELRHTAEHDAPPPPLVDSPKCPRCSLVAICLPDETNLLRDCADIARDGVRRLVPARDDALPLYVQSPGAKIGRSGAELVVDTRDGEPQKVRMTNTSHVAVFGAVQISTQAIQELSTRGISIAYLSSGGWFYALTRGMDHKNVELRRRQFAAAEVPELALQIARRLIAVKIRNSRTLVRRNASAAPAHSLERLKELAGKATHAPSLESLLGVEGAAARLYFEAFAALLRPPDPAPDGALRFDFEGRNRRPPRDPVNAVLSLGYALLTKDLTLALQAVGFDPYLGFFHQPRYGRPALALDLMEEFRPLIVDSIVLSAINTGALKPSDFLRRAGVVALTPTGRGKFLRAYERRMDEEIAHPIFGYRISYRRTLEVQIRLFARFLTGEIAEYPPFATR